MVPLLLQLLREDEQLPGISFFINELFLVLLQEKVLNNILHVQHSLEKDPHILKHLYQELDCFYEFLVKEINKEENLNQNIIRSFIGNYYEKNAGEIKSSIESRMETLGYNKEFFIVVENFIKENLQRCHQYFLNKLKNIPNKQVGLTFIKQAQEDNKKRLDYHDEHIETITDRNVKIKEFFESGYFSTEIHSLSSYTFHRHEAIPRLLSVSSQYSLAKKIVKHISELGYHDIDVSTLLYSIKKAIDEKSEVVELIKVCLSFLEKNWSNFEEDKIEQYKNIILYCLVNYPDFNAHRNIFGNFLDHINVEERLENIVTSLIDSRYRFKTLFFPSEISQNFKKIYNDELLKAAKEGNTPFMTLLMIPLHRKHNIELKQSINNIIINYCTGFSLEVNYVFHCMVFSHFNSSDNLDYLKKGLFENIKVIHNQVICQLQSQYKLELMLCLQEFDLLEKFDNWFINEGKRLANENDLYIKIIGLRSIKNLFNDIYHNPSLASLDKIKSLLHDEIKKTKALFLKNIEERKELLGELQSKFKNAYTCEALDRLEMLSLYMKEVYSRYEPFKYTNNSKQTSTAFHTFGLNKDLTTIKGEIADKDSSFQAPEFLLDNLFNVFIDPKDIFDDQGNSLLHVAAAARQVTAAALCIMNGLFWHSKNNNNEDVLKYAHLTKKDPFYQEVMYIAAHKSTFLSKKVNTFLLKYQDIVLHRHASFSQRFFLEIISRISPEYKEKEKLCASDRAARCLELERSAKNTNLQMNDSELQRIIDKMYAEIANMPKGSMGTSVFAEEIRSIFLQGNRNYSATTGTEVPMIISVQKPPEEKHGRVDKGKKVVRSLSFS